MSRLLLKFGDDSELVRRPAQSDRRVWLPWCKGHRDGGGDSGPVAPL